MIFLMLPKLKRECWIFRSRRSAVIEEVRHAVGAIGARALAKGLQFSVETIGEAPGWVEGDAARVKQVVSNLASNAVKFTEVGSVTVLVCQEAERLVIQIEDTGPGMSADVAARVVLPIVAGGRNDRAALRRIRIGVVDPVGNWRSSWEVISR